MTYVPEHTDPEDINKVVALLRQARPNLPEEVVSPRNPVAMALRQEILSMEPDVTPLHDIDKTSISARILRRSRQYWKSGVAVAAALALIGTLVAYQGNNDSESGGSAAGPENSKIVLSDIRTIAARSQEALSGTGRATIDFVDGLLSKKGTTKIAFSGEDFEATTVFDEAEYPPLFTARYKAAHGTVFVQDELLDREFDALAYAEGYDLGQLSAPEVYFLGTFRGDMVVSWVFPSPLEHTQGPDQRALLSVLSPAAELVTVGTETIAGEATTHLRATKPGALPSVSFGLRPIDGKSIVSLDLWVGGDDVIRRIDIATEESAAKIRSSYSVRYFDISEPVVITASDDLINAINAMPLPPNIRRPGLPVPVVAPLGERR